MPRGQGMASDHQRSTRPSPGAEAARWEAAILGACRTGPGAADPAHDEGHLRRVLAVARRIAAEEGPHDPAVLTAAALLHDLDAPPKDSPLRPEASRLSADAATGLLRGLGFPEALLPGVAHAIEAHSFSAGVEPVTPEARMLRDADRLDALGAVGIARCFAVGGALGRRLADPDDPLAERRPTDDSRWGLDHFRTKLLRLPEGMCTASHRAPHGGAKGGLRLGLHAAHGPGVRGRRHAGLRGDRRGCPTGQRRRLRRRSRVSVVQPVRADGATDRRDSRGTARPRRLPRARPSAPPGGVPLRPPVRRPTAASCRPRAGRPGAPRGGRRSRAPRGRAGPRTRGAGPARARSRRRCPPR